MSKKLSYGLAVLLAVFELLSVVLPASAAPGCGSPICDATGVVAFFNNVSAWFATIFWIVAVISGFYAGYLYLLKGGTDDISKAHRQLLYTVIAIAVGLMVYGLPVLIKNILNPSP